MSFSSIPTALQLYCFIFHVVYVLLLDFIFADLPSSRLGVAEQDHKMERISLDGGQQPEGRFGRLERAQLSGQNSVIAQ